MTKLKVFSQLTDPRSLLAFARGRKESAALGANAAGGILLVLAAALSASSCVTNTLVVALAVLFGPLVGACISSVYPRVERATGNRLGGVASLDELYRLFAWTFLPLGTAALLYSLLLLPLNTPGTFVEVLLALPSLAIAAWAVRGYCFSMMEAQGYSRKRGYAALVISLVLFCTLIAGGGTAVSLAYIYGLSGGAKGW